jgi:hypothetical protein
MIHEVASGRKKWADYESDSDSEDDNNNADEVLDITADAEEADEDFDDDKEGDEIADLLDLSKVATTTVGKKSKPRNLSKKERMELRQKELEDLETILAEYKKEQVTEREGEVVVEEVSNVDEGNDGNGENEEQKNKRKKKKKHQKSSNILEEETSPLNDIVQEPPLVDIGSVLKAREKKKSTKVDPSKIALEEALKNSSAKKKKRDKSKFSEGSY